MYPTKNSHTNKYILVIERVSLLIESNTRSGVRGYLFDHNKLGQLTIKTYLYAIMYRL